MSNTRIAKTGPVLVAPLDWGLGHATRCIPLVRELINQGLNPWLAGENGVKSLLQTEFPDLPFLDLPGYRVHYARSAQGLFFQMLMQSPRILQAIRRERKWLKQMHEKYHFSAVISDNRFGLTLPGLYSVFITHQLQIRSPLGKWSETLLRSKNYKFIQNFRECWVPDYKNEPSLAGELSHPSAYPAVPLFYTGPLSRFEHSGEPAVQKGHLLFILSGPEPQRSILEEIFLQQIPHYPGTATLVRGLPSETRLIPSTGMIKMYNHLSADLLAEEMQKAEFVISRCGYSTVMDLVGLQKKSILIPTPGQTEQEYLAKLLPAAGLALTLSQKDFRLSAALQAATGFNYHFPDHPGHSLPDFISQFRDRLNS